MAHSDAGHGRSFSLRVASWGDPDLDLIGSRVAPPTKAREAAESIQPSFEGPDINSESYQLKLHGEGQCQVGLQSSRRHNLRPRNEVPNALYHLQNREDDDDDQDEVTGEIGEEEALEESEGECKRKSKKKVGRPIAYTGDPDSPHLTELERRRLRRRVANRESARRVRNKRQETMEELQSQVAVVQTQNERLASHIAEVDRSKSELLQQLQALQAKSNEAAQHNARLREEIKNMQRELQDRHGGFEGDHVQPGSGDLRPTSQPEQRQGRGSSLNFAAAAQLPTAGSGFDLPSVTQLTPIPSHELVGRNSMQRESSVPGPPEISPLPDIQPLTGLEHSGSLSSAARLSALCGSK